MTYEVYTDNKCTGTAAATLKATKVPVGNCFQADFGLTGWATLASQKEYIRVDYCREPETSENVKGGVFFHTYSDTDCKTASTTSGSSFMGGSSDCQASQDGVSSSKWT